MSSNLHLIMATIQSKHKDQGPRPVTTNTYRRFDDVRAGQGAQVVS